MQEIKEKLDLILEACEEKKGIDIKTIDISSESVIADHFVIVSGNTSTQVKSISDGIEKTMEEAGYGEKNFVKEGYAAGRWILLDYNAVVVHVFHKDEREFYNLERLWQE